MRALNDGLNLCLHSSFSKAWAMGFSARVGMAQDLAAAGMELPALMTAGGIHRPQRTDGHGLRQRSVEGGVLPLLTSMALPGLLPCLSSVP